MITHIDLHYKVAAKAVSSCPQESVNLYRLGKSRFYIYDVVNVKPSPFDRDGITWAQGHKKCRSLGKLLIASNLNKITTNGLIARGLERKAAEMKFRQTVYWINARYDTSKTRYYWGANKKNLVHYGNFYYKQPRPIGVGAHYGSETALNPWNNTEKYDKKKNKEQCLAFALAFMNRKELGFQASWLERSCKDRSYRRVLCESSDPACEENKSRNPHVLTEDKEYYFTEGNWIFANRRFIVNWAPRNHDEAKEYCKNLNLELFNPLHDDECLIPYLKLWAPVLSTYNFWTGYTYFEDKQEFRDENGQVFQKGASLKHDYSTRTSKSSNHFCVAYQWTYEFKNETRCGNEANPEAGCEWMYYILAPSNCNNFIGTVCQHASTDNTSERKIYIPQKRMPNFF
ncbi:unnamed protein product [Orchesella dallaii]|uniref:C-type lectin domain-containing protein n=1 Tax=Orchesella dallaii TaxID=48710 RepID=A0ABP1QB08_9HEXA